MHDCDVMINRCSNRAKLDAAIAEMFDYDDPVLFDVLVEKGRKLPADDPYRAGRMMRSSCQIRPISGPSSTRRPATI
ncbi:MAG: hypothetical protein MO846_01320, partial [Candidatus Devosia symbiotica]|nr:hypothetical protein [Candidatus Devosia symbiotica]